MENSKTRKILLNVLYVLGSIAMIIYMSQYKISYNRDSKKLSIIPRQIDYPELVKQLDYSKVHQVKADIKGNFIVFGEKGQTLVYETDSVTIICNDTITKIIRK